MGKYTIVPWDGMGDAVDDSESHRRTSQNNPPTEGKECNSPQKNAVVGDGESQKLGTNLGWQKLNDNM